MLKSLDGGNTQVNDASSSFKSLVEHSCTIISLEKKLKDEETELKGGECFRRIPFLMSN